MSPEPNRADAIVEAALDLPSDQRAAFLDSACVGHPNLRQLVEALVKVHQQVPAPHRDPAPSPSDKTIAPSPSEKPGDRIGRYKLLQQVGEGGCGVVYMAEQEEPVRRRVALKVIKLGMDTRQVIARFEAERQALALMDHPNIAKVLDAGATDSGRPYFVMELVRGIKITDYCDQHNLTTQQRLDLFIQVCHAIQHAHQKGVIHRDIKPSNILVTLHDGVPVPKVIDFGIAKATEQRLTDKTLFTALDQLVGTPAYMSPEQAEMSGLDIDTRSDIYSLGVLLYELLTGQTPFDPKELTLAGLQEMRRIIREKDPLRPSTRLSSLNLADQCIAAKHRQVEAPRLIHLVRGDLDWIVLKCLEKDRARRYDTANGLASDLQRHLHNEPVVARPPSNAYRLQKLVRRNKLLFAAISAVAATVVLGLTLSTWLFLRERQARHRAIASEQIQIQLRQQAQSESAKSQQVAQFLKHILTGVAPDVAKGRDTTVLREILAQATNLLSDELKDFPEVKAELLLVLAKTYDELSLYTNAIVMATEALRLRKSRLGAEDPAVADALSTLGAIHYDQRDLAAAERVDSDALAMRRRLLGNNHTNVATSLNNLGNVRLLRGDLDGAERAHREALDIRLKLLGNENIDVAKSLNNLANVRWTQGDLAGAEAFYRDALAQWRKLLGNDSRLVATALNNLATAMFKRGHLADAEAKHLEALQIRKRFFHDDDHSDIAASLNNLADVVAERGRLFEAEELARKALIMRKKLLGDDNADVAESLYSLAIICGKKGDFAQAEAMHRQALEMRRKVLAEEHLDVAESLTQLALVLAVRGDLAGAEANHKLALEMNQKLLGSNHLATAISLWQLAWTLRKNGDATAADSLRQESVTASLQKGGASGWMLAESIFGLADLLQVQGKFTEAEPLVLEAAAYPKSVDPADLAPQREALEHLVRFYQSWDTASADRAKPSQAAQWTQKLAELEKQTSAK